MIRRQIPATTAGSSPALISVLHQAVKIEAKIDECAEDISSVNALLKEVVTVDHEVTNAEQALMQSEQLEQKIETCTEELRAVNAALAHEVKEQKKSERAMAGIRVKLIGAQLELVEAQGKLAKIKEECERARYFAFHDPLTGLPNLNLFSDRLQHALAYATRHRHILAVMCIDVDKFKSVNEAHTRQIEEELTQASAQRLDSAVRAADTVALREGGSFLLMLDELAQDSNAGLVARKLIRTFSQPLEVEGLTHAVIASIGIAIYPRDGETAEDLIDNADTAMQVARQNSNGFAFFSS